MTDAPPCHRRWFHSTPDRLVLALLVVERNCLGRHILRAEDSFDHGAVSRRGPTLFPHTTTPSRRERGTSFHSLQDLGYN